jgi:ribonuclease HI
MPSFTCTTCGTSFSVPRRTLDRFPNWTPKQCMNCRPQRAGRTSASAREEGLTVAQVLDKYTSGPTDGVFTDGAADPNPGPGGWGAVYVVGNEVVGEAHGHEPHTTNNRMELTAIIAAYDLVPEGVPATIYSDSNLAVRTVNEWAPTWERNGWKRRTGPVENLELVQRLHALARSRPELKLQWIKAHAGSRWNEYADSLATAYRRSTL